MNNSRRKNATLNIVVGIVAQVIILLLGFVGRRIFVQFLSADYLGINGLYGNILSVLALAELGLGNVTQFFLYKPVADNDTQKICALVKYFRKLYTIIALSVLGMGVALLPFLHLIVNSDLPQDALILYFLIFLLSSCVSYFAADKIALLAAHQDQRLIKYVALSVSGCLQILHIIVLLLFHNYTVYIVATLAGSIANVMIINYICKKRYPYINKHVLPDNTIEKKLILENVKSTFIYKIGATIVNNTTSILLSIIVSTAAVGIYSNYCMIVLGIQAFIAVITTTLISGIGNLSASGDKKRLLAIFNTMLLVYNFIAIFGGVSFFLLLNDFILIWLGSEYLLDNYSVFAIAFSFYITNAISPVWMLREANGIFNKVKYLLLVTAVCNIVISIILGKTWGLFGILLAPSIARIVTQGWYEPHVLFRTLFDMSSFGYWKKQFLYLLISLLCVAVCCSFSLGTAAYQGFLFIFVKGIAFFVLCAMAYFVFSFKTEECGEIKRTAIQTADKLLGRIRANGV